ICTSDGLVWVALNSYLGLNSAHAGGAIANFGGHVLVTSSLLLHNTADLFGGALYNMGGSMTVNFGSTLQDNQAESGGSIYNRLGNLTVTDSHLVHNSASSGAASSIPKGPCRSARPCSRGTPPDNIDGPWTNLGGNSFI